MRIFNKIETQDQKLNIHAGKSIKLLNPRLPLTIPYIILLILFYISLIPSFCYADEIYRLLMDASKGGEYSSPSMDELRKAERLFTNIFNGIINKETRSLSNMLGFTLIELKHDGKNIIVLKEDDDKKRGRGFFIFRRENHNNITIQIPHVFTDIHTRRIGYRVFIDTPAHAIAFNTIKRDKADMAHIENSYFIAFAIAFAQTDPSGYLVQLHGFSKDKRVTISGKKADVIISSGREGVTPITAKIYNCLKDGINTEVSLYSQESKELGGRRNSVGAALRRIGYNGFVHIEMSRELRESMVKDEKILKGLERCIQ